MSAQPSRPGAGPVGADESLKASKQRSIRQPLGVKNVMNSSAQETTSPTDEQPLKTMQPMTRLLPPPRLRKASVTSAAQTPSPTVSTSSHQANLPASSNNTRSYTSHHPSPLGNAAEAIPEEDSDNDQSSSSRAALQAPHSPSIVKTPKKRAVPMEDVHVRNTVPGRQGEGQEALSQSPNPNKRSRSSKHGSSATDPSTSTSLSIAAGLGDVHLQSYGAAAAAALAAATSRQTPQIGTTKPSIPVPPTNRPTTTRIDKQSRMTENERLQRERQKAESHKEWRRKYLKTFPQFRFYLDGLDEASRLEATTAIDKLGASIEPFFSNNVTHLVTARKIPAGVVSEVQAGPLSLSVSSQARANDGKVIQSASVSMAGGSRASVRPLAGQSRFSKMTPVIRKKNTNVPLHSDRNPFEECGPPLPANDILVKARDFKMKVWSMDKFRTVISTLIGIETHGEPISSKEKPSLVQMLEKEKVQGALEKDPLVARDNFHYFQKNSVYVLIEDATAEHRAILVQEWRKPAEGEETPWPVLHGELEGRCPFTRFEYEGDHRRRMKPNRHETLRRVMSLNQLKRRPSPIPSCDSRGGYSINRGASPYPLASGNSVSVTSNIASTTSNATMGGIHSGLGIIPPYGAMSRKMTTQGNALGLGRPSALPSSAVRSPLSGNAMTLNEQTRGSLVRRMLGIADQQAQSPARRSVSTPSAVTQLRREKKAGYCENCRLKYDDFDEHILCRKHRKFAEDNAHFSDIDTMLNRVTRPIAAWAMEVSSPSNMDEQEASSTSSLLAAGGSLIEAEAAHVGSEDGMKRRPSSSPRNFRHVMEQWQQKTHIEIHQDKQGYGSRQSSPQLPRSPMYRNVSLPPVEQDCMHDGASTTSSRYEQSVTTANNTTTTIATTGGQRTEEEYDEEDEDEERVTLNSPDTSPQVHHQQEQKPDSKALLLNPAHSYYRNVI